jgi:hypothetical protein
MDETENSSASEKGQQQAAEDLCSLTIRMEGHGLDDCDVKRVAPTAIILFYSIRQGCFDFAPPDDL